MSRKKKRDSSEECFDRRVEVMGGKEKYNSAILTFENYKNSLQKCSICIDPIFPAYERQSTWTVCGHTFHEECMRSHLKTSENKNCPLCRQPFKRRKSSSRKK